MENNRNTGGGGIELHRCYDRTIFYNPSSKYCVISVKTSDQSIPQQARSAYKHRDHLIRFTAVGYELPQTDKVSMILDGEWQSGKYGQQLQVTQCEEIVPQTRDGCERLSFVPPDQGGSVKKRRN